MLRSDSCQCDGHLKNLPYKYHASIQKFGCIYLEEQLSDGNELAVVHSDFPNTALEIR